MRSSTAGIANDDAALGRERNGADDRDRNADQQRTRRRHDEHRQEANRLAAPHQAASASASASGVYHAPS